MLNIFKKKIKKLVEAKVAKPHCLSTWFELKGVSGKKGHFEIENIGNVMLFLCHGKDNDEGAFKIKRNSKIDIRDLNNKKLWLKGDPKAIRYKRIG